MLGAELTQHLGYEPDARPVTEQRNRRNGATRKTLKGNDGTVPIDVPRDHEGSFEPKLIKKGQTRIDGMDDKIIGPMPPDYRPVTSAPTSKRAMA